MKTIILSLLVALTSAFVFTYSSTLMTKMEDKDSNQSPWERSVPGLGFNIDKDANQSPWDRSVPGLGYNTDKDANQNPWERSVPGLG